jgi:metal-dependent HD superfamily phosphatase/phosphodiesterase
MKDIIEKAKELVKVETANAVRPLFAFANETGQKLAEKLNADKDIVMLGTLLMDVKHKQAMKENRLAEHVKMSLETAKEFLSQFELDEEIKNKIYNCVEAHHREVPFICIEAEICANADCYKFLAVRSWMRYITILAERDKPLDECLDHAEEKLEEKWKNLSLDICKEELEPHYNLIKEILAKAREK